MLSNIHSLAKSFGIDPNRVDEMDEIIVEYKELFDDFTWIECVKYLQKQLKPKFTDDEYTFIMFIYGISVGINIMKGE